MIGAAIFLAGILAALWVWRRRQGAERAARYPGATQAVQNFGKLRRKLRTEWGWTGTVLRVSMSRAIDIMLSRYMRHSKRMNWHTGTTVRCLIRVEAGHDRKSIGCSKCDMVLLVTYTTYGVLQSGVVIRSVSDHSEVS